VEQSPTLEFCNSLIFKIPTPHMFVSGHLPLNQIHHFQILQQYELNQIWANFANCNYGTQQTLFEIVI
jgi:hypothetical protein